MLTIGSRGSNLALTQTHWVRDRILDAFPGTPIEIRIIRTSADQDQKSSIRSGSSTGVFVKEIEDALLAGQIDLAVHSMKDLPTRIPEALEIAAVPEREDPRDAILRPSPASGLSSLPPGSRIGTGSIRRQAQILATRPDLKILDIRGNVDTRIKKMEEGSYDAVVLACAGLRRLGLESRITFRFDLKAMLPAPGQGALALETRRGDHRTAALLCSLHHAPTAAAVDAERAFLSRMGGGCNSPIAVYAQVDRAGLTMDGLVAAADGTKIIRETLGPVASTAEEAGRALAERILSKGGRELLTNIH